MAVTTFWYGPGLKSFIDGDIDFLVDTIKFALATNAYTPNQDTHDFFNDVTNEVTGTGYTAGGVTVTTKTSAYTSGTNTVALDFDDPSWATSTITARYGVLYKSTGTSSTSPLIGYTDFGADVVSTAGTFTYTVNASGFLTITAA